MERTGGIAPDLPGFGSTAKPEDFDYSLLGYADFLERFVDERGLERFAFVVHDIGAIAGLVLAQRIPERIERLVVANHAPLLPGYRWHRFARIWRVPVSSRRATTASTSAVVGVIELDEDGSRAREQSLPSHGCRRRLGPIVRRRTPGPRPLREPQGGRCGRLLQCRRESRGSRMSEARRGGGLSAQRGGAFRWG